MESKKRTSPSDYPLYQFRISVKDKEEIQDRVTRLIELMNSKVGSENRAFRKNDIVVEAIKRGLASLEKEAK